MGLKELPVSEAIYRLVDPADVVIDVGANIGHMTSIMAVRTGPSGRVLSFEPHPLTYEELRGNTQCWAQMKGVGAIRVYRFALSDTTGSGSLGVPGNDSVNRALASMMPNGELDGSRFPIQLRRLEEFVAPGQMVGLMKVDVEGREYEVLKGAQRLLRRHEIRDIIFEEFSPYPSQATTLLSKEGYQIFYLGLKLWGPTTSPASVTRATREGYMPIYLATTEPSRALGRLKKRGWMALRSSSG
jgi:FkbM family methyltransferase